MGRRYWTKEELKFLVDNYGKISTEIISKTLNRTIAAIIGKTTTLGLGSSIYKNEEYVKICKHCGRQYTTKIRCSRYCSRMCSNEQSKIIRAIRYEAVSKDLKEKRKIQHEENKVKKEKLRGVIKSKNYDNVKIFFELNCLGLDAYQGIEKIREFTNSKNAEKIYRLLRKEFIEGSLF